MNKTLFKIFTIQSYNKENNIRRYILNSTYEKIPIEFDPSVKSKKKNILKIILFA